MPIRQSSAGKATFDPLRFKLKTTFAIAACILIGMAAAPRLGMGGTSVPLEVDMDPRLEPDQVQPAASLSDAFVNIANAVTPAVVRIEGERTRRVQRGGMDMMGGRDPVVVETATGSGFVVSADGYVLTNNHVVEGVDRVKVYFRDGRSYDATLVGGDPTTDVAALKIEGSDFPAVSLGSSSELRVGEWIVAVGNPGFGGGERSTTLNYTVTAGIVSALGRPLDLLRQELQAQDPEGRRAAGFAIEDFIQTDAVINPGNSGGPMVNLMGQVVGINSAIMSGTGFYQGYGFAVPIDLAYRVMQDLVDYGQVRRAFMGISMRSADADDAYALGLEEISGVLVQEFPQGSPSPARSGGMEQWDVITHVDGEKASTANQLQRLVALKAPGDAITVRVSRCIDQAVPCRSRSLDIDVRLGEAPLANEREAPEQLAVREPSSKIGLELRDMTPTEASMLGARGALITDVAPNGPAARKNLRRGCVVRAVQGQTFGSAQEAERALSRFGSGDVVSIQAKCPGSEQTWLYNVRIR